MEKFTIHTGTAVAVDRANIDTDQIIPKQFLKRVERTGYGQFLFYDWRFDPFGEPVPGFPLDDKRFSDASILVAGTNFGCGSSREHAAWSLMDFGFRAIIAPSFGDIFYNNSLKNGLLPIRQPKDVVGEFTRRCSEGGLKLTIDLEAQCILYDKEAVYRFDIDEFNRNCLLNGLDEIALTLVHEPKIAAYEMHRIETV